jgi:MFS family permease
MTAYLGFIRQHWPLLGFGFTAVFWGNFGQSFFVAWFGADIQRSLGLSAGEYGSAYSLATLASAITVVWAGGLIDKLALRTYAIAVAIGLAVALVVLSQANTLLTLLIGFFLLRLFGQSLLPHTGITTMARYFDDMRGKAISVAMSGVPVGEVILPIMAVALVAAVGWQATLSWVAFSVFLILIPLMLWLLHHANVPMTAMDDVSAKRVETVRNAQTEGGTAPRIAGRTEVLRDYRFWLALPGLMVNPFMITGIFIHQNFLADSKGWSMSWLATCFIVYGVVHWISSLVSGALVDRFQGVRLLPYFLVPMVACLLIAAFVPGNWPALLMMALLGMSAGSSPPITGSLWPEIYGTRKLGSIRAMNMALMVLSTAISPVLFGYFIDRGVSLAALFGACTVYVMVAIGLIMFSYPSNSKPVAGAA